MRELVGLLLILLGSTLGLVGDYPIDSLAYRSLALMVAGGLLVALGMVVLLLQGGRRGSRDDEPDGHIHP